MSHDRKPAVDPGADEGRCPASWMPEGLGRGGGSGRTRCRPGWFGARFTGMAALFLMMGCLGSGAELRIERFGLGSAGDMEFEARGESGMYYVLERGSQVDRIVNPRALGVGQDALLVLIDSEPPPEGAFYRMRAMSIHAPADTDRDGIDDLYEWARPGELDPLNAADAALDPDGNGRSHLAEYRALLGISETPPPYVSREIAAYNTLERDTDQATFSREVSAYSGQVIPPLRSVLVVSGEVAIYHHGAGLAFGAESPELSVYLGAVVPPVSGIEPISREVVVHNLGGSDTLVSREMAAFNHGEAVHSLEAISLEVSVQTETETTP